jgi:NADPH2:quinone reductase
VNYRTQDFVAETLKATGGRGADVVLDMVAGEYLAREVQCLADDGRLAVIAVQGGIACTLDAGLLLRKRLTITGSTLRPRSVAYKTVLAGQLRETVWPLIEAGRIKPVIHQVFPAAQAAAAHALMESSTHVGKIVLSW